MRYELCENGYINKVFFGCHSGSCTLYEGIIPDGYETLEEWAEKANIRAYKIVNGNLVYDSAKDEELQKEYANCCLVVDDIRCKNLSPVSEKTVASGIGTSFGVTISKLKPQKIYTLSFIKSRISGVTISNAAIFGWSRIVFYNGDTELKTVANPNPTPYFPSGNVNYEYTFTTPDNCNKVIVYFDNNNGDDNYNTLVSKIQLEEGPTATYYVPYKVFGIESDTLYDNTSGTTGTVSLSESAANYSHLEIFFKSNDGIYNSMKIDNPNGKKVHLGVSTPFSYSICYLKSTTVTINETTISVDAYSEVAIPTSGAVSVANTNVISIIRVVGYR